MAHLWKAQRFERDLKKSNDIVDLDEVEVEKFIPEEDLSTFGKNQSKNLNCQYEILLLLSLLILFS